MDVLRIRLIINVTGAFIRVMVVSDLLIIGHGKVLIIFCPIAVISRISTMVRKGLVVTLIMLRVRVIVTGPYDRNAERIGANDVAHVGQLNGSIRRSTRVTMSSEEVFMMFRLLCFINNGDLRIILTHRQRIISRGLSKFTNRAKYLTNRQVNVSSQRYSRRVL